MNTPNTSYAVTMIANALRTFALHASPEDTTALRAALDADSKKLLTSLLSKEPAAKKIAGLESAETIPLMVYALWVDPTIGLQGYIYALVDDPHRPGMKCVSMFCSVEKFLMGPGDSLRRGWKRGKQSGKFADLYFPTRRSNECFFRLSPTGKKVPNWAGPVTATYAPQGSCYTSPSSQYIPLSVRFQLETSEEE